MLNRLNRGTSQALNRHLLAVHKEVNFMIKGSLPAPTSNTVFEQILETYLHRLSVTPII